MPHVALHLLLATNTIDDGIRTGFGLDPGLKLERPTAGNAFLHGAIGPDMGFFPGGEDLLSQAAHLVRSGDLVRRLLSTATEPEQRAFSFGWLTHMLGDVLIHPIINRTAAELLDRERTAATAAWHRNAHIRVELGAERRLGPHSSAAGFLNTTRPSRKLVREVDAVVAGFTGSFERFGRLVLDSGVNYDLDTGQTEAAGRPTPDTIRLLRRLAILRQQQTAQALPASSA